MGDNVYSMEHNYKDGEFWNRKKTVNTNKHLLKNTIVIKLWYLTIM